MYRSSTLVGRRRRRRSRVVRPVSCGRRGPTTSSSGGRDSLCDCGVNDVVVVVVVVVVVQSWTVPSWCKRNTCEDDPPARHGRRWWVTSTTAFSFNKGPRMHFSNRCRATGGSTALSGSSNNTRSASAYTARASATRAFCPPDKLTPCCPISVRSPSAHCRKSS